MLAAIVFDFDGVIANSEPLHYLAYRDVLAQTGVALSKADYFDKYLGYDDEGAFRAMARDHRLAWDADIIAGMVARKAARMEALERDVSVLFPGAADAIRRAAEAVPIAIASGALGMEIRRVLDREGLIGHFSAIVGADDTEQSKPAPDPYLRALALLSSAMRAPIAARECVAIEDSVWGLESARRAGLRTVGVAQTYEPSALPADIVIDTIAQLEIAQLRALAG